jgi:hypothetical protein
VPIKGWKLLDELNNYKVFMDEPVPWIYQISSWSVMNYFSEKEEGLAM